VISDDAIIVLFDGVCNLCNGSVQFIIKRDPAGTLRFASLQSEFGQSQLKKFNIRSDALHSIILIEKHVCYQRSDAALKIASRLTGLWPALSVFRIIPRFIRDALYNLIAANRYRMFGKQESCMLPTPALRARFIQ